MAAARPSTCTTKGRKEWDETIEGAGEKICRVETEGHARFDQGVEDGGGNGGEEKPEQGRRRGVKRGSRE
jgi:hypothetical protein